MLLIFCGLNTSVTPFEAAACPQTSKVPSLALAIVVWKPIAKLSYSIVVALLSDAKKAFDKSVELQPTGGVEHCAAEYCPVNAENRRMNACTSTRFPLCLVKLIIVLNFIELYIMTCLFYERFQSNTLHFAIDIQKIKHDIGFVFSYTTQFVFECLFPFY